MAGDFGYCEACSKRITPDDFVFGDAVRKSGHIFCSDCYRQSAAETGELPARPAAPKSKPSTRVMPASGSRRRVGRKKRRISTRKIGGHKKTPGRGSQRAQLRSAEVQKLAASVVCPYCYEKLVVKVEYFPVTYICDICGKTMRISAPTA